MVLKSIGDLESLQSKTFFEEMAKSDTEEGVNICKELYMK